MLPLGKISQVTRSILQKSRACSHVPLTTAFDCASPNSRINNILNQWNYMKEENNKKKQQIKEEKAKKHAAKYEVKLLPDYSKKIAETSENEKIAPINYITTADNRRISREFFALLRSREQGRTIDPQWLNEITLMKATQPDEFNSEYKPRPQRQLVFHSNKTRQLEEMSPHLAKYLRETMERNDIMSKIYGIDFYERSDPQSLKHILNAVNKNGVTGLSLEQRAKLDAFLKLSYNQSPEEFRRQLMFLKGDGVLSGPMVDYFRKLLENNSLNATNEHMRKQLSVLKAVDKIDRHWGGSSKSGQKRWGDKFSFNQQGKNGNRESGVDSQFGLQAQNNKRWNFLKDYKNKLSPDGADGARSRGKGRIGNKYSYDYQNGINSGTGRTNSYRYNGDTPGDGNQKIRLSWNNDTNQETVYNIHNYSQPDIFATDLTGTRNHKKKGPNENQYFQILRAIKNKKSSVQLKEPLEKSPDDQKVKYYYKRPWERRNIETPKRKKIVEPVVEKKRMERYQIPPPKEKKNLDDILGGIDDVENTKASISRASKIVRLNLIPRVKKSKIPALPDRSHKTSILEVNFSGTGYFGPPKVDKRLFQTVILSGRHRK